MHSRSKPGKDKREECVDDSMTGCDLVAAFAM